MKEESVWSNGKAPHRTVYNVDSLLNAFSSLDEEQQEIGEKKNRIIDTLLKEQSSDSSSLRSPVVLHPKTKTH